MLRCGLAQIDHQVWWNQRPVLGNMLPTQLDDFPGSKPRQICDARMWYAYEYLGNGPRLVGTSVFFFWDLKH